MGKFNAATAVEDLEYDFTKYDGGEGVVPEPSTVTVRTYFQGVKAIMKQVRGLREMANVDIEEMSDEDTAEMLSKIDEASEDANRIQDEVVEWVAFLCGGKWEGEGDDAHVVGGTPNVESLQKLPFRVMQEFNTWLMEQIQPKRKTPGSKR